MKILTRQDLTTGKIFADIVLTHREVLLIILGKVVSGEKPQVSIQIVGYGKEESKNGKT